MVSPTKRILLTTLLANACRVLLAVVFMVSGFVKAVDPVGFMYKMTEYSVALDLVQLSSSWILFFALLFSGVEFIVGFFLLTGIWRKTVATFTLLILLFYTPLTLYIAIENPVPDCGCFGDALLLGNWQTFAKNVFLLAMAVVVVAKNSLYRRCLSSRNRWMAVLFALAYILLVEGMSVWHLPVIDFRPYAIGTNLREAVEDVPPVYETTSVYEKGGEQRTFATGSLPDSTWNYIGSSNRLVKEGRRATVNDFAFLDRATGEDFAAEILADTGYVVLVVLESLDVADESRVDKINDIYDYCEDNDMRFYAATSSADDAVEVWCRRTGAEYSLLWADDIALKTMVRVNPGLLLIKDGYIVEKWNITDVPDVDKMSQGESLLASGGYVEFMRGWLFWLLLFAGPVAVILFLDMFVQKPAEIKDDKQNK